MGTGEAEQAFAKMMGLPGTGSRHMLRDLVMRHRVALDAGLDHRTLRNEDSRRQLAMEARADAAVRLGVGSAAGMPTAPELLFGDPLPVCDRWGTSVSPHYSTPIGPLHMHQTLGYEARAALPQAVLIAKGERLGPHGLVKAQFQTQALPCVSYTDVVLHTLNATHGNSHVDYGMAVHMGVSIKTADEVALGRDIRAVQQDGARRWPPAALRDTETAAAVAEMVSQLCDAVLTCLPEAPTVRASLGTAGVDMYWRMCIEQLDRKDVKYDTMRNFQSLGVCAYVRQTSALPELHRRALIVALLAHTRGEGSLGFALVRLADIIDRCIKA